jgi:hypothetical protein
MVYGNIQKRMDDDHLMSGVLTVSRASDVPVAISGRSPVEGTDHFEPLHNRTVSQPSLDHREGPAKPNPHGVHQPQASLACLRAG